MEEALQVAQARLHFMGRRRDEGRIPRSRAADPVLGPPELAGIPLLAAPAGEQDAVDLAKQP